MFNQHTLTKEELETKLQIDELTQVWCGVVPLVSSREQAGRHRYAVVSSRAQAARQAQVCRGELQSAGRQAQVCRGELQRAGRQAGTGMP
jgi:hypothetical protein